MGLNLCLAQLLNILASKRLIAHGAAPMKAGAYKNIHHQNVCAIGFAPGFAFLAELDDQLVMPRRANPRAKVPAGSVAIAEKQTAVYPADSPGGWHVLGQCPLPLFDLSKEPMTPFSIGDQVRFVPVDRETFIQKGGIL